MSEIDLRLGAEAAFERLAAALLEAENDWNAVLKVQKERSLTQEEVQFGNEKSDLINAIVAGAKWLVPFITPKFPRACGATAFRLWGIASGAHQRKT